MHSMYKIGQGNSISHESNVTITVIFIFFVIQWFPCCNQLEAHAVLTISFGNWLDVVFLSTTTQQSFGKFQELYIIFTKQPKIATTVFCCQISQWHIGGHAVALRKWPPISINCIGRRSLHVLVAFCMGKTSWILAKIKQRVFSWKYTKIMIIIIIIIIIVIITITIILHHHPQHFHHHHRQRHRHHH